MRLQLFDKTVSRKASTLKTSILKDIYFLKRINFFVLQNILHYLFILAVVIISPKFSNLKIMFNTFLKYRR